MNTRFTRIITRWVNTHEDYGVRALLDAMIDTGLDGNDEDELAIGTDVLPVTIYNDVDDACMFPRYNPTVVPALALVAQVSTPSMVRRNRGQLDFDGVEIGLSYIERDQPELFSRRRGDYVLTAVSDSLLAFNEPKLSKVPIPADSNGDTWRTLGGEGAVGSVEVTEILKLEQFRVRMGVHNATMFGAVLATCRVRRLT
jgi:hypothetical protein